MINERVQGCIADTLTTFVASNQQQLTLTSCFKYDSESDIILER